MLCFDDAFLYHSGMEPSSRKVSRPADPYSRELIETEIAHLKKGGSTRHAQEANRRFSRGMMLVLILALLWLYGMDPILFAYNRGDAIRAYLYLHNYGSDAKAAALATSGYFSPYERQQLDRRIGSFQDYFVGTKAAADQADALMRYQQGVHDLHSGGYKDLTTVNKIRFVLFIDTGLTPPVRWNMLNPSIGIK